MVTWVGMNDCNDTPFVGCCENGRNALFVTVIEFVLLTALNHVRYHWYSPSLHCWAGIMKQWIPGVFDMKRAFIRLSQFM